MSDVSLKLETLKKFRKKSGITANNHKRSYQY